MGKGWKQLKKIFAQHETNVVFFWGIPKKKQARLTTFEFLSPSNGVSNQRKYRSYTYNNSATTMFTTVLIIINHSINYNDFIDFKRQAEYIGGSSTTHMNVFAFSSKYSYLWYKYLQSKKWDHCLKCSMNVSKKNPE